MAQDGDASLYTLNNLSIIRLEGNFREMGQQYGRLMKEDISRMYDTMIKTLPGLSLISGITTEDELLEAAMDRYSRYPQRFAEISRGMSETSGIPVSHIVAIDQFFSIIVTPPGAPNMTESGYCSSLIAWGQFTDDGPLVMGRNFDFFNGYQEFYPYLVVIIYNPDDGSVPVATLGYAGNIGGIESFNAAGLVLETNDNHNVPFPNNITYNDRIPFNLLVFQLLLDSATIEQLDAAMRTTRFEYPLLFNVADEDIGYTYEGGSRDIVRRGDIYEGLQVITNLPVDVSWSMTDIDENLTSRSVERRDNLLHLSEKYLRTINMTVMKAIIDTPIEEGGAGVLYDPEAPVMTSLSTIYRFVYEPESRTLVIRSPAHDSWNKIDLDHFFYKY